MTIDTTMFSFFIICFDKHGIQFLSFFYIGNIFYSKKLIFNNLLLYASILPCSCGYLAGMDLSLMLLCCRKRLNILDINCLPLSCITFSGLPFSTMYSLQELAIHLYTPLSFSHTIHLLCLS
jgi:hypothetical protein